MSAVIALAALLSVQDAGPGRVNAWIDRQETADGILFVAKASAVDGFTGSFRIVVDKTGGGGTATTRQAGTAVVPPSETVTLSTVALSRMSVDTEWSAVLELVQNDQVVATDRQDSGGTQEDRLR